jgi:anthranilate phosphoribosyltransferase
LIEPGEALRTWMGGGSLSRHEMEELFGRLMDGTVSDVHKAALLVALAMKGEAPEEIAGAAVAMRARSLRIAHDLDRVVDTCGTGGDGRGTFNISTAAAFVAAAAGATVAKHGNRSVSSRSGSADVLQELGANLELTPGDAALSLREVGMAFLFAPKLHPAMREVMPVRRELAVRTVFNVLGPLTNPAGARRQVLGVYAPRLVEILARVLAELEAEHALVVHGSDGLDEITTTGPTWAAEVRDGSVRTFEIDPATLGVKRAEPRDLAGGTPAENAVLLRRVLEGERGPLADIVAVNAAAALWIGGHAADLGGGLELARTALDEGAAARKLDHFLAFGRGSERGVRA